MSETIFEMFLRRFFDWHLIPPTLSLTLLLMDLDLAMREGSGLLFSLRTLAGNNFFLNFRYIIKCLLDAENTDISSVLAVLGSVSLM